MSRAGFAVLMAAIAIVFLGLMWLGWRRRSKRDAGIGLALAAITGDIIAEFSGIQYVSTTQLGLAFERVSIAGLRYKGRADLSVRTGGVTVTVTGEDTVAIPVTDVIGVSRANGRVGKAVEAGGIAVLEWRAPEGRQLESGFRFSDPAQQRQFEAAVAQIIPQISSSSTTTTTQEDA